MNTSTLHEKNILEARSVPTTDQMFRLGSICICLAKEDGLFKESRVDTNAHTFLSKENEAIEMQDSEGMRFSIHKFTGKVARIGFKQWKMRIFEHYTVRGIDESGVKTAENIDWYQQFYTFEWSDKEVSLAARRIEAKPDKICGDNLQPDSIDDMMFEPDFVGTISNYVNLTGSDCWQLIAAIQGFRSELDGPLKYNC